MHNNLGRGKPTLHGLDVPEREREREREREVERQRGGQGGEIESVTETFIHT